MHRDLLPCNLAEFLKLHEEASVAMRVPKVRSASNAQGYPADSRSEQKTSLAT